MYLSLYLHTPTSARARAGFFCAVTTAHSKIVFDTLRYQAASLRHRVTIRRLPLLIY